MMCCHKKLGQILVRSWRNSSPEPSRCQCTMMIWGTVFSNDCCSRLDGSITKVWQPFTSNIHTGNLSDINDVSPNGGPDLCQILKKFSPTDPLYISEPSWHEVLYPPMIVAVGLLGPLPRSDNPSQAHTHWEDARHQWCVVKNVARR